MQLAFLEARSRCGALTVQRPLPALWQLEGSEACKPAVLCGPMFCGAANEDLSEKPLARLLRNGLTSRCTGGAGAHPSLPPPLEQSLSHRDKSGTALPPALHCAEDAALAASETTEDGESPGTFGPTVTQLRSSCPAPWHLFGEEIILC